MFDTIHMSVPFNINYNHDDEIIIHDDIYIKFNPAWNRLIINCSIPKLLYENNLVEINESDIEKFFTIVHNRIKELFHVEVHKDDWQVHRLDFCKNFKMESSKQVTQYIHNLSKIILPRKTTITYNNETVIYKNKSQSIQFYDKYKEMMKRKADYSLLEQAKNILRFEIQCRKDILKQYSSKRKAVDLLTKEMYKLIMNETLELINSKLELIQDEYEISPNLFDLFGYSKLEKVFAFMYFLDEFGESFLKPIYSSSYYNRKKILNEFKQAVEKKERMKLKL